MIPPRVIVLALASLISGCTETGGDSDIPGAAAPEYEDPSDLLERLQGADIGCFEQRRFDTMENLAPDGVRYPVPQGVMCSAGSGRLYLIVYDNLDHRVEALTNGEVNVNLCGLLEGERESWGWQSVVGGNWRVATPLDGELISDVVDAFDGEAGRERISCEFKE